MPQFSWKSKEGYERFKDHVECKLGHKLVDTLETWLSNKYTANSKPSVICQKKFIKNTRKIQKRRHRSNGAIS